VHNTTTINIAPGPHAEATASRVAEAQTRVHEQHVRVAEGKLLA
jgi:hypothetical protein